MRRVPWPKVVEMVRRARRAGYSKRYRTEDKQERQFKKSLLILIASLAIILASLAILFYTWMQYQPCRYYLPQSDYPKQMDI